MSGDGVADILSKRAGMEIYCVRRYAAISPKLGRSAPEVYSDASFAQFIPYSIPQQLSHQKWHKVRGSVLCNS